MHQPNTMKRNKPLLATKEMTNAEEIKWALKHEEEYEFNIEAPETKHKEGKDKNIDTATTERLQPKLEVEQHLKNKQTHKPNKTIACGHVIGQCTQAMKNKLEAREDWTIDTPN